MDINLKIKSPLNRFTTHLAMLKDKGKISSFNWIAFMQGYNVEMANKAIQKNYDVLTKYFETFVIRNIINQCSYMITSTPQSEMRLFNLFNGIDQHGDNVDYNLKLMSVAALYECFRVSVKHSYFLFPLKIIEGDFNQDITRDSCLSSIELVDSLYIVEKIINDPSIIQYYIPESKNIDEVEEYNDIDISVFERPILVEYMGKFTVCFKRDNGVEVFFFELNKDDIMVYLHCLFIDEDDNNILFSKVSENQMDSLLPLYYSASAHKSNVKETLFKSTFFNQVFNRDERLKKEWMEIGNRNKILFF